MSEQAATPIPRRKLTQEDRRDAAHLVIDEGQTPTEVASEMGVTVQTVRSWVAKEKAARSLSEPMEQETPQVEKPSSNMSDQPSSLRAFHPVYVLVAIAIVTMGFFAGKYMWLHNQPTASYRVLAIVVGVGVVLLLVGAIVVFAPTLRLAILGDTRRENSVAFLKITAGVLAVLTALIAVFGVLRTVEINSEDQQTEQFTQQTEQRNSRYIAASQQLGDDTSAVRAAGVLALASLADDWLRVAAASDSSEHPCQQSDLGSLSLSTQEACSQARLAIDTIVFYLRKPIPLADGSIPPHPLIPDLDESGDNSAVTPVTTNNMFPLAELDQGELAVRKAVVDILHNRLTSTCRKSDLISPGQWTFLVGDLAQTYYGDLNLGQSSEFSPDIDYSCVWLTTNSSTPLSFDNAVVYGELNLMNTLTNGSMALREVSVGGNVSLEGANIGGTVSFKGARIGGSVSLEGANIGNDVSLEETGVGGSVWSEKASIGGSVWLTRANIGGAVFLSRAIVTGNTWFARANISGSVQLDKMSVDGSVSLEGARVDGSVVLEEARVKGSITLGFNALTFQGTSIGDSISLEKASIGGNVILGMDFLSIRGTSVGGSVSLEKASIGGTMSLLGAHIGINKSRYDFVVNVFSGMELPDYEKETITGTTYLVTDRTAWKEIHGDSRSEEDPSPWIGPGWSVIFDECTLVNDSDQEVRLSSLTCP